jgi:hypothetical protein
VNIDAAEGQDVAAPSAFGEEMRRNAFAHGVDMR